MLDQFLRSVKTFKKICRADKVLDFNILQSRIEKYLGFSVFFIDPARIRTRLFELSRTEKMSPELQLYGNYYLLKFLIPENPVVISLGIGEDTRFDEAILDKHAAKLYMFDPTPRSFRYVRSRTNLNNAKFTELAISDFDGEIEVYIDDLETDLDTTTSVSVMPSKIAQEALKIECKSILTILKEEDLQNIDVLKIDIEGGGLTVIQQLLNNEIFPAQICGEFERPVDAINAKQFFIEMDDVLQRLNNNGYRVFRTRKEDIGFQIEITAARYVACVN